MLFQEGGGVGGEPHFVLQNGVPPPQKKQKKQKPKKK